MVQQCLKAVFVIKNKYRLKFKKVDRMRFIGHLDLLKIVQRTVTRSKLPISYSKGFNPHQIMSFALPLSLSVESVGEYLDIELEEKVALDKIKNDLNKEMPNGLEVLEVIELEETRKAAAAELRVATYEVKVLSDFDVKSKVEEINSSKEVLVMKKTKRSFEEVDLKPDIFEISFDENTKVIHMLISTGSQRNIKPDHILDFMKLPMTEVKITRIEMFLERDGQYISLIK